MSELMKAYGKKRARARSKRPHKDDEEEPRKRKPVAKKKEPRKRKPVAKKKVARKRKPAAKKKVAAKRKPAAKKKVAAKRKPAAKKRVAAKRKPTAKKKVAAKRKPAPKKRKPTPSKPVPKKTTKRPTRRPASQLEKARRRLRKLVEEAKRKKRIRRRPRLPKKMRHTPRVDGGEQRRVQIERVVTVSNVEDIMRRISRIVGGMSGLFPLWLTTLELSALGDKLIGYGQHLIEIEDEDDEGTTPFQMTAFDSTGLYGSSYGMLNMLEQKLDDYASDRSSMVFLHSVRIMNFRRGSS